MITAADAATIDGWIERVDDQIGGADLDDFLAHPELAAEFSRLSSLLGSAAD